MGLLQIVTISAIRYSSVCIQNDLVESTHCNRERRRITGICIITNFRSSLNSKSLAQNSQSRSEDSTTFEYRLLENMGRDLQSK